MRLRSIDRLSSLRLASERLVEVLTNSCWSVWSSCWIASSSFCLSERNFSSSACSLAPRAVSAAIRSALKTPIFISCAETLPTAKAIVARAMTKTETSLRLIMDNSFRAKYFRPCPVFTG